MSGRYRMFYCSVWQPIVIIGTVSPGFTLDVNGTINSATSLKVGGVTVCDITGCAAASSSGSYIQNSTSQQVNADYNIDGNGVLGGTLTVGSTINGASSSRS